MISSSSRLPTAPGPLSGSWFRRSGRTLLLFPDRAAAPRWAIPLAEPPASDVPLSGEVEVRGDLVDGGAVVPVVREGVLWPSFPVSEIDPDVPFVLVSGELPDDSEDEEDDGSERRGL